MAFECLSWVMAEDWNQNMYGSKKYKGKLSHHDVCLL
jgi:hypothetical protein